MFVDCSFVFLSSETGKLEQEEFPSPKWNKALAKSFPVEGKPLLWGSLVHFTRISLPLLPEPRGNCPGFSGEPDEELAGRCEAQ